ncbi:MAG: hypothetical protein LBR15_10335 [Methanobrevibacter sp.]|jgi:hypothetical protein|nr:hypothetical protein [Candidatus Methanovirga australis]
MKTLRIYLENSVIGGYFDDEFETPTKKLFEEFEKGFYKAVISTHVTNEIEDCAPQKIKDNLSRLDYENHEITKK